MRAKVWASRRMRGSSGRAPISGRRSGVAWRQPSYTRRVRGAPRAAPSSGSMADSRTRSGGASAASPGSASRAASPSGSGASINRSTRAGWSLIV
ncbi:MAG: hypothetical protein ACK55I_12390 [bacterium]